MELSVSELVRVLNNEFFSTRLEAANIDIVRERKREVFSAKVELDPIEMKSWTECPLKKVSTKLIDPVKNLK